MDVAGEINQFSERKNRRGNFKVKFVSERKPRFRGQPGDAGNFGGRPWVLIVEEIMRRGINTVENVRRDDSGPGGNKQLDGKQMLALWKAVENKKNPN